MNQKYHLPDQQKSDWGPEPFVVNIACLTQSNKYFRKSLWTGHYLQLTLMCIPVCGEIGLELHSDTDQFIRCEGGQGLVRMGKDRESVDFQRHICKNEAVFIPTGWWHNIINTGRVPLTLYSIYAPPHHPHGTIHRTKTEADAAEPHE